MFVYNASVTYKSYDGDQQTVVGFYATTHTTVYHASQEFAAIIAEASLNGTGTFVLFDDETRRQSTIHSATKLDMRIVEAHLSELTTPSQ